MKIIILTNHKTHIEQDSFYDIVTEIYSKNFFSEVSIASVGLKCNKPFYEQLHKELYVNIVTSPIKFDYDWNKNLLKVDFNNYDVVFFRIDQPISEKFLSTIKNKNKDAIYINDPIGMIRTNSKKYLLNFKKLTPSLLITDSLSKIIETSMKKQIVIKPIKSYGGKGISKAYKNNYFIENKEVTYEVFTNHIKKIINKDKEVLVMDYLKNNHKGDKRIIVFNGKIIGSILRVPNKNSWICNASQGATSRKTSITENELKIIKLVDSKLKKEGILLYGIDTLENDYGIRVLSEINTANVGGFIAMEKLYLKKYISHFITLLIKLIKNNNIKHLQYRAKRKRKRIKGAKSKQYIVLKQSPSYIISNRYNSFHIS